jgi:ribosomal protein L17
MAADDQSDRARVVTYVPTRQKTEWTEHADKLGMSQAEFVRTMVQAGRKDFTVETNEAVEPSSGTTDPRGDDLETRVLEVLESNGSLSWEQLVETLSGDFEDRLESCLDSLQADDRIRYSGRNGGYTRIDP